MQFSGHNPLICADELIEVLSILWIDNQEQIYYGTKEA